MGSPRDGPGAVSAGRLEFQVRRKPLGGATLLAAALAFGLALSPASSAAVLLDDAGRERPLRVFIDCASCGDDLEYIRAGAAFVDHMRDPADADLYVFIAHQPAGASGHEVTILLKGHGPIAGMNDTLRYFARSEDSDDERRRELARHFRLGLVRYAVRGPAADRLDVTDAGAGGPKPTGGRDPWRAWVYKIGFGGRANGAASQSSLSLDWALSGARVTASHKFRAEGRGTYSEDRFGDLSAGQELLSISRQQRMHARLVWSVGPRWSTRVSGEIFSYKFANVDFQSALQWGLEYAVFPYEESLRREFRIAYSLGAQRVRYHETTIYDRMREVLLHEAIEVTLQRNEDSGTATLYLDAQHFLHDLRLYHLRATASLSRRLSRGVSLVLSASGARIHDQLSLPRGAASDDEILLRQRLLATDYDYSLTAGLTFTFGSKLSRAVNPRFGAD